MKIIGILLIGLFALSLTSCQEQKESAKLNGFYETADSGRVVKFYDDSAQTLTINPIPVVLYTDIAKMEKEFIPPTGNPIVYIELTEVGKAKFAEATKNNIGKPLGIIFDGKLLSAPIVQTVMDNGKIQISGIDNEVMNIIVREFAERNAD